MIILRLILLLLGVLLVRRIFRALVVSRRPRPKPPEPETKPANEKLDGLTQQGISDADFEEIP